MINFPAPLSLCAISSFVGSILTVPVQLLVDGGLNFGAPSISITTILTAVIVSGVATAVASGFQTWCVIQKGPVLVTIFNPIQTVCCTILSAITLGQVISLGSFAGILLMFTGLYIVLWAKKKEGPSSLRGDEKSGRGSRAIEEPLIS